MAAFENDDVCAICLDPLSKAATTRLPCSHFFHSNCVEELREFGVSQSLPQLTRLTLPKSALILELQDPFPSQISQACPMCRAELPPGPEQLHDKSIRRYIILKQVQPQIQL